MSFPLEAVFFAGEDSGSCSDSGSGVSCLALDDANDTGLVGTMGVTFGCCESPVGVGVEIGEPFNGVAELDLLEIRGVEENPIGGLEAGAIFLEGGGGGGEDIAEEIDADD